MSIYITQGHEQGIGLEVFFKSCLLLSERMTQKFILLAYKETVKASLTSLNIPFKIAEDSILITTRKIKVQWLKEIEHSQSFTSLNLGMKLAEIDGILYTLPTSKDQFPGFAGHTEYFRSFYRLPELGMFFSSPDLKVLLVSDHIALADVAPSLKEEVVFTRLNTALSTLQNWQWPIQRVLIAGFNPHAGEGGLIGHEDKRIAKVIKRLSSKTAFPVAGPFPGDTMLLEKKSSQDLLVYLFHDQGLGVFKGAQGFIGSNITLGLNYPRFSPDHGTSFGLYGKNMADYRGCAYSLKEAFFLLETMANGKNSSNQSKSS